MTSLFVTPRAFGPYFLPRITGSFSVDCQLLKKLTLRLCYALSPHLPWLPRLWAFPVTILKFFCPLFILMVVLRRLALPTLGPAVRGVGDATHPETPSIQHLRVAGKVHVQGSVVADSH